MHSIDEYLAKPKHQVDMLEAYKEKKKLKAAPQFDVQRYEEYYNKRQGKPEIYCTELARKPESFYLINKISLNKTLTKEDEKMGITEGYFELPTN